MITYMRAFVFFVLILTSSLGQEEYDNSKNVLILTENPWVKDTHSMFIKWLSDHGYTYTVKVADDPSLTLMKYGDYVYKHVFILAPSVTEFGGSLNVKELIDFVDNGGNLLIAANSDIGVAIRELGAECGVEFDEEHTSVIDHFNYDLKDDGTHTRVIVSEMNLINSTVITGGSFVEPFLYKGVGISADPNNPLLIDILHASETAYSYIPTKTISDYPNTVGTNTKLITGLQARNNARVLLIGSLDFFSNSFFTSSITHSISKKTSKSGNEQLSGALLRWLLGESGQLRVAYVKHSRVGEQVPPQQYTITDDVQYTIAIETKNDAGHWVPFRADDVQLEFVRIDPFIRRTLTFKDGKYTTTLKLPDVYGVFKFVVDYYRPGYTHLLSTTQVPVRPFNHTQYERFITAAYPYYFSSISMLVGVTCFSFVFLYFRDDKRKTE